MNLFCTLIYFTSLTMNTDFWKKFQGNIIYKFDNEYNFTINAWQVNICLKVKHISYMNIFDK